MIGDPKSIDDYHDEPKELFIGADLPTDEAKDIINLLKDFSDIFDWTYADMPGLDSTIVEHKITTGPLVTPT
ncbi:hypothetical protein MLD38_000181 [Melastoma candidum]|uniref:Uncharacterized protein n=1 Tax=Melastoma candidum TaxID=119954 RepID=A0ACB9S908_9MYRT|nr:hypothetical protein MLD38_000181 [Melastoma candidum]